MSHDKVIEPIGFIVAGATLLFSLILFYTDNSQLLDSLLAAVMAAGLTWITYIILRWVWLAIKE